MKWDITRGIANAGAILATLLAALVISLVAYHQLNRSHPLEGGFIASTVVLGSPLILGFQVLAVVMTKQSELTGSRRLVSYVLNILGAVIALLFVMFLIFLWRMGPINPG